MKSMTLYEKSGPKLVYITGVEHLNISNVHLIYELAQVELTYLI